MTGLNGLRILERKSTSDHIRDDLRQMIIEGSLLPGEQLGEARIAEQMGVSRAPVREALQQLVQEKLLVAARNRGVSVATFTAVDVWEIYDARCAMHPSWSQGLPANPEMDLCTFCREKSERKIRLAKT